MDKLTIEVLPRTSSTFDTMRISGFEEGELQELKAMPHYDAEVALIKMLNERNDFIGRTWEIGYGIYSTWFDDEFAYMNIGKTCD